MRARLLPPWRRTFFAQRALPASVLGPVECRQGARRRVSAAWRARRSGDHPALVRRLSRCGKPLAELDDFRLQHSDRSEFFGEEQVLDAPGDLAERPGAEGGVRRTSERAAFVSISKLLTRGGDDTIGLFLFL